MKKILLLAMLLLLYSGVQAADDTLINLPPGQSQILRPGRIIYLQDGRSSIIQEILPDGRLKTDLGLILTPEGVIIEGGEEGSKVLLTPPEEAPKSAQVSPAPDKPEEATPKSPAVLLPTTPVAPVQEPVTPVAPQTPEHHYTIAELLPTTEVPEKKATPPAKKAPDKPKVEPKKIEPPASKAEPPVKKVEPKPREKPAPPPKQEKKAHEEKKSAPAPKPGQALRIPPDAPKTGNLAFLEGCWQGTRPEYYSKRTIKECFCFGAGGKSGKRRVIDPIGHRQCIGSTRATLSSSGVLSVTSSGAACNDGERWGQAEMICRNTGPKTPCSWIFRDANNGQQSYQIPFVRVESCGR